MTTFYICRHGQTENNLNQRFSGWIDTPLTAEGVQNAHASATKLGGLSFDTVIASDLGRAFVTAYIITRDLGLSTEIQRAPELREVNYGDYANRPYTEYPHMTPEENGVFVAPNGESLSQMQQRVMAFIQELAETNPDKTILLVAHDGTINAIRGSFLGQSMGDADLTRNAHDAVARFTFEGSVKSFEDL